MCLLEVGEHDPVVVGQALVASGVSGVDADVVRSIL